MPSLVSLYQEFRKRIIAATSTPWAADPQIDFTIIDGAAGNVTINLPSQSAMWAGGRSYLCYFKRADQSANTVTLVPPSGLIDGAATRTLQTLEALGVITDGVNYFVVRTNIGPASQQLSGGFGQTSAVLLLGAQVDLVIPISPVQVDTNYQVSATLANAPTASLLGSISVTWKTKATNSVTVTIKNNGLVTLAVGQGVDVTCLHN